MFHSGGMSSSHQVCILCTKSKGSADGQLYSLLHCRKSEMDDCSSCRSNTADGRMCYWKAGERGEYGKTLGRVAMSLCFCLANEAVA